MIDDLTVLKAERERRHRQELLVEAPKYDWYGPDCGCPAEGRKSDGSCPAHKRARDNQRPPEGDDWIIWYIEAGRGFGKTEAGAQWIQHNAETLPAGSQFVLAAPTAESIRSVMLDGPSGIMKIAKPWFYPDYQVSKSRLVWPNGTIGLLLSGDEPERFRGPQSMKAWVDEPASFRYPEAIEMLLLGLRLGDNPQLCMTGTPKPHPWLRRIKRREGTVVVKGSTYENVANLARSFFATVIKPFEGTRLGRQELNAEDLEDTPGALWTTGLLDDLRAERKDLPEQVKVVVAVDPSAADPDVSLEETTAECGIAVGMMGYVDHPTLGKVPHGYLLADRSLQGHPSAWAKAAINAYHEFGADAIVAERNNGGAMVASTLNAVDSSVPVRLVWASRGKQTRAEPIAAFYEQRRIRHLKGQDFAALESQLCTWVPGLKSPDRLDALVWLFTDLMLGGQPISFGPHPFPEWE
jgi:phage terminase large subunit-like protein